MVKTLIVDDSMVVREYLKFILNNDDDIEVVGVAGDGWEGVEMAKKLQPDVITMDIQMPKLDGLRATRLIMESVPTPIVIVSANWEPGEIDLTFKALEMGAVTIIEKPRGLKHPDHEKMATNLIRTVKMMKGVTVERRNASPSMAANDHSTRKKEPIPQLNYVAIGSSTGGPLVLREILSSLPADFPVPIFIVQHIAKGFTEGMVDWINNVTKLQLKLGENNEHPQAGTVYIAPDDRHMGINRSGRIVLSDDEKIKSLRPAVAHLFGSLAKNFADQTVAVLLTGMGSDGAAEMKALKDGGAITIAQSQSSSTIFGMPKAAIDLGGATFVLDTEDISRKLIQIAKSRK